MKAELVEQNIYRGHDYLIVRMSMPDERHRILESTNICKVHTDFLLKCTETFYNGYIRLKSDWDRFAQTHIMPYDYLPGSIHGGFTFLEHFREKWEYFLPGTWAGFDTNHGYDDKSTRNVDFVRTQIEQYLDNIYNTYKTFPGPTVIDEATAIVDAKHFKGEL